MWNFNDFKLCVLREGGGDEKGRRIFFVGWDVSVGLLDSLIIFTNNIKIKKKRCGIYIYFLRFKFCMLRKKKREEMVNFYFFSNRSFRELFN